MIESTNVQHKTCIWLYFNRVLLRNIGSITLQRCNAMTNYSQHPQSHPHLSMLYPQNSPENAANLVPPCSLMRHKIHLPSLQNPIFWSNKSVDAEIWCALVVLMMHSYLFFSIRKRTHKWNITKNQQIVWNRFAKRSSTINSKLGRLSSVYVLAAKVTGGYVPTRFDNRPLV